jgi:cobaltochelatase CobT
LSDATEPEDGAKPQRHEAAFAHQHEWGYKVYTAQFDEEISASDLCEPEELARLRGFLDQQLSSLQGVVSRLANKLQRLLMAQQNRHWEYDLKRHAGCPRLTRIIIDPMYPLSFKREGHHLPRYLRPCC